MAEQLALEERLDDRRAVHRDEALRAAWSKLVQGARNQLLAGAGLARDEHGAHVRRKAADQPEHLLHRRAAAHHATELEPLRQVAFQGQHLAPLRRFIADGRQQLPQPLQIERLGEVIEGSELDRFDRAVDRRVAGHEDDLALRADVADRTKDVEARDAGHAQIEQHELSRAMTQLLHGVFAVGRRRDVESFGERDGTDQGKNRPVVIDHEQARTLVLHEGSASQAHT